MLRRKTAEKPSSNRQRKCLLQDEVGTLDHVPARWEHVESAGVNVKGASAAVMESVPSKQWDVMQVVPKSQKRVVVQND